MRIDNLMAGAIGAVKETVQPVAEAEFKQALSAVERRAITSLHGVFGQGDQDVIFRQRSSQGELKINASELPEQVTRDLGKLRDASEKLEALLVEQMLSTMDRAMPKGEDGPMGGMARDMMRQQLGVEMSRRNGTGLADTIFRQGAKSQLSSYLAQVKSAATSKITNE